MEEVGDFKILRRSGWGGGLFYFKIRCCSIHFLTIYDCITNEAAQNNIMSQTPMTRFDEMKSFLASSAFIARPQSLEGRQHFFFLGTTLCNSYSTFGGF